MIRAREFLIAGRVQGVGFRFFAREAAVREGLRGFVRNLEDGRVEAPRTHSTLMQTLGSQFIAHPPIAPYRVDNVKPGHPLVAGIESFEVEDERLYRVEGDFPRLTRESLKGDLPRGIPDNTVHYELNLDGCGEWLVTDSPPHPGVESGS